MAVIFTIVLVVVFFAVFALLFRDGIWSNAIALLNGLTAAIIASFYFEPLARFLGRMMPSLSYVWDLASIWILLAAFYLMLRGATDYLSKTRPRITRLVDQIGGILLAAWLGWAMVCFTTFSLHTAPLAREFLGGGFDPESRMLFGTAPDRQWLGFLQKVSGSSWGEGEANPFDPQADFMIRYATRRAKFEQEPGLTVAAEEKK